MFMFFNLNILKIRYMFLLAFIIPIVTNAQEKTVWSSSSLSGFYDGSSNASEWADKTRAAYTDLRYNVGRTLSDYEYKEIIGNSYYKKEFVLGKIFINNKVISKKLTLRYNAFSDEIEVGNTQKFEALINNRDISCLIGKDLYIYHPYTKKDGEAIQTGYLRTIFKGQEFLLLIRETKIYKEGKKAKTTLETSFPGKLVDVKEFYLLKKSNENAVFIKQKNKKVLEIIDSDYKPTMSKYLKDNNLNVKEDKDLINFFKYYDSLNLNK